MLLPHQSFMVMNGSVYSLRKMTISNGKIVILQLKLTAETKIVSVQSHILYIRRNQGTSILNTRIIN